MITRLLWSVLLLWPLGAAATPDFAQFAYQQKLGNQVPLDAEFRDEANRLVHLADFASTQPIILALGYFHCPNLCGVVRGDLIDALSHSGLDFRDYTLLLLSIDPSETPSDAHDAKQHDVARLEQTDRPTRWHYLVGSADEIQKIEQAVGFRTRFDPEQKQFLHPSGIVFLTSDGVVSSYLLGVGYQPGDVHAAVLRAHQGGIAQTALPVLLLCFHYDPSTGRYTLAITKVLELACVLTALTLGGTIAVAVWHERRS